MQLLKPTPDSEQMRSAGLVCFIHTLFLMVIWIAIYCVRIVSAGGDVGPTGILLVFGMILFSPMLVLIAFFNGFGILPLLVYFNKKILGICFWLFILGELLIYDFLIIQFPWLYNPAGFFVRWMVTSICIPSIGWAFLLSKKPSSKLGMGIVS